MKLIGPDQYEALFLADTPLLDTRAPIEFARGSFPTATNLPLLSDDERAQIGTCYKQKGQAAAITLGHQLVSGSTRSSRIDHWQAFAEHHPQGALFCFRGGIRSQIAQEWLGERGIEYPRVAGGYKALRQWLSDQLNGICLTVPFLLVGGRTGAAKTRLLNEGLDGRPLSGSIDLEGLAHHRGSSFGRRAQPQPSQIQFEIALSVALLKLKAGGASPIIIEDEGHLIGRCALPSALQNARRQADWVLLEAPLEQRVEHSFDNYILSNLEDLCQYCPNRADAFAQFSQELLAALGRIQKRLGGQRHSEIQGLMREALAAHEAGNASRHKDWIRELLVHYYDPMYEHQMRRRDTSPLFRGNESEVAQFLRAHTAD